MGVYKTKVDSEAYKDNLVVLYLFKKDNKYAASIWETHDLDSMQNFSDDELFDKEKHLFI